MHQWVKIYHQSSLAQIFFMKNCIKLHCSLVDLHQDVIQCIYDNEDWQPTILFSSQW